jgi:hypothetical protein
MGYGLKAEGFGGPRKFPPLYLGIFLVVHLAWSKQAGRYLFPVLPICAIYFFRGTGVLEKRLGFGPWATFGAMALSLALSASPASNIIQTSLWRQTTLNSPPQRTFDWIRKNTGPSEIFATELDGRFFLHTGRPVLHLPKIHEPGRFRSWLQSSRVCYVVLFPNDFIMRTSKGSGPHDPMPLEELKGFLSDQKLYEQVFKDSAEGSEIYRVLVTTQVAW